MENQDLFGTEENTIEIPELELSLNTEEKGESEKGLKKDEATLLKFNNLFKSDKEARSTVDWQWFVWDSYTRGNHFVKWNNDTASIEIVPSNGVLRFPVNKIYSTLRAVRGWVTKYDPKWEVFPENKSIKAVEEARYKQKLLDDYWYNKSLKHLSKQKVYQGLKLSIGIKEIGWDEEAQEVTYTHLDPFDVYFGGGQGPHATRVTKCVRRKLEDILADPKYKGHLGTPESSPDEFESEAKQLILETNYGRRNSFEDDDEGTIVREMFYYTEKENSLGGHVNIATFTEQAFLRHIETDYDSLWDIFMIYRTDENPGETYGEGWVKHLVPVQKMLDILESQTMEYHHMFAKGRYLIPKNAGARVITNENGVMIEYDQGRAPKVENAPSMAASVQEQIQRLNIYLEDLGGQHDASLGRIPTGATAGVAIEALQEGDANNLKDLRENFELDLVATARATFKMIAKKLETTKVIECDDRNADGQPDFFAIIGEDAPVQPKTITHRGQKVPVVVIRKNEKVRVTVGTWLAYTKEAYENRIYKHYTAGLIDRKTALEALRYTDTDLIVESAIKEQLVTQMVKAGPPEMEMPQEQPDMGAEGAMNPEGGIPTPPIA